MSQLSSLVDLWQQQNLILSSEFPHGAPASGGHVVNFTSDSREVVTGSVFFALRGVDSDGHEFLAQAIASHASLVCGEDEELLKSCGISWICFKDSRAAYAIACRELLSPNQQKLHKIAVTGTNGKTSTAHLIQHLLSQGEKLCGLSGTIANGLPGKMQESKLTTPDVASFCTLLENFVEQGASSFVCEASSHGLHQQRLAAVKFDIAIFTNLTQDHLDYHKDMQEYFEAKALLFQHQLKSSGLAILNAEDAYYSQLKQIIEDADYRQMTYGSELSCDVQILGTDEQGQWQLYHSASKHTFTSPLAGRFNAQNCAAAILAAIASGLAPENIQNALDSFAGIPGRMQLLTKANGARTYIDYAHTADGLEKALLACRTLIKGGGRLYLVFGCGGDRDTSKRTQMGEVAAKLADKIIVTDDNPRTEDAAKIRAAIITACPNAREIGERAEAIAIAWKELSSADVFLLAGKGHEDYQLIAGKRLHFSDAEQIEKLQSLEVTYDK